ncbi:MAG: DUF4468 domain-containing protein [Cytophagaceae bacterium]|jgi:hypothetical protein|nr:DUF4468 domain-containing protein [Cytophagaceae bacterium]
MKKTVYLFLLVCLSPLLSFGQLPIDSVTKKVSYTGVEQIAGATMADLYKRAKNCNADGSAVVMDNSTTGIYSYKGSFSVLYSAPQPGLKHSGKVSYAVTIAVKDGRYKYVITDLVHTSEKGNGGGLERSIPECNKYVLTLAGWAEIKKQAETQMNTLVANIKRGMNPSTVPANIGNDW